MSDRWVVLKGLLNTGDADALAVAIVERQFLAQVEHPLIVEIYNFVTHDDAGYIVMEYVGGTSLKQILKERMRANGGGYDPLPVDQALAYILEVLPAFQYLHDLGLVYCDFKPDNLIQVGDAVKLIDLGGVRRIDDDDSAIYGTVGYQAPEVAQVGTTRRLRHLHHRPHPGGADDGVPRLPDHATSTSLPPVEETPLFQQHDSLYRLLAKACAPDPADRFASVDELRVQLLGVLREVVAERTAGTALTSAASVLFEAPAITSDALEWDELPALRVDTTDPQYAWLSNVSRRRPRGAAGRAAAGARSSSPEVLAGPGHGRAASCAGRDLVDQVVNADAGRRPVGVAGGLDQRPGGPATRRLRGRAVGLQRRLRPGAGRAGAQAGAGAGLRARRRGRRSPKRLYRTCASTDANYVAPAAFGLARIRGRPRRRRRSGRRRSTWCRRPAAASPRRGGCGRVHLYESGRGPAGAGRRRWTACNGVRLDPREQAELTAQILERALAEVDGAQGPKTGLTIGPYPADDESLRDGLEATYRTLAGTAETDDGRRYALVDQANAVRRWTLR